MGVSAKYRELEMRDWLKVAAPIFIFVFLVVVNAAHYNLVMNGGSLPFGGDPLAAASQLDLEGIVCETNVNALEAADFRLSFHASGVVCVLIFAAALVLGSRYLFEFCEGLPKWIPWVALVLSILGMLVALIVSLSDPGRFLRTSHEIYSQTMGADAALGGKQVGLFGLLNTYSIMAMGVALFFSVISAFLNLRILRESNPSPEFLISKNRALHVLLYLAAMMLIARLVIAYVFATWMGEYIELASLAKDYASFAQSLIFSVGVASTTLLIAFYLPAMATYKEAVGKSARVFTEQGDPKSVSKWISENNLDLSNFSNVLRLTAFLGPILTGPSLEFLKAVAAV